MPDDQRQLRHLLSLLAELHERCLPPVGIQQLRDPDEDLAVLLADAAIHARSHGGQRTISRHPWGAGGGRLSGVRTGIAAHREAVVVLMLSYGRSGGSSLSLGMLLSGERGVLLLLVLSLMLVMLGRMVLLLVLVLQPGGLGLGILMLVGKDVLRLSLEHGERRGTGMVDRVTHSGWTKPERPTSGRKRSSLF